MKNGKPQYSVCVLPWLSTIEYLCEIQTSLTLRCMFACDMDLCIASRQAFGTTGKVYKQGEMSGMPRIESLSPDQVAVTVPATS